MLDRHVRAHPRLRVELLEDEAEDSLPRLLRGRVDVVIAEEYQHAPRPRLPALHRVYLEPAVIVITLPRDHAAAADGGPVSLASLADCDWVTARAGTAYADMCTRLCRSVGGFEPDIRHRVNDMRLLLDLVARGSAAFVPALGQPEQDPRVAVRRAVEGRFSRAIFVAVRASNRARPSTAAVVAAVSP